MKKTDINSEGISYYQSLYSKGSFDKIVQTPAPKKICECDVCRKDIFRGDQYAENTATTSTHKRTYLCFACYQAQPKCKRCGNFASPADLYKEKYCIKCLPAYAKTLVNQYSFKVEREIKKIGRPKSGRFAGIELELESNRIYNDTVSVYETVEKFARLKKDSSIKNGFEVVSCPIDLENHKVIWNDFFSIVGATDSLMPLETCGMHVHISRQGITDLQIGKMLGFIHNPANRSFIEIVAGRSSSYHNNFAQSKKLSEAKYGGRNQINRDRHTALNLNNVETVEFRIFASTKCKYKFLSNIEFCFALISFCEIARFSISESLSWKRFFQFVVDNRKDYVNLYIFLSENAPDIRVKSDKKIFDKKTYVL